MALSISATPLRAPLYKSPPKLPLPQTFSLSHNIYINPLLKTSLKCVAAPRQLIVPCSANRRSSDNSELVGEEDEDISFRNRLTQAVLWVMEGVYILWLFLLPYAPVSIALFLFNVFTFPHFWNFYDFIGNLCIKFIVYSCRVLISCLIEPM